LNVKKSANHQQLSIKSANKKRQKIATQQ